MIAEESPDHQPGPAPNGAPPTSLNADASRPRPRLLLVDDDRLILATLADSLRNAGYDVSTAAGGKAAVDAASAGSFDLAILDVRMPGMDGIELSRHLREGTSIPFLFLSAYTDAELVHDAVEQGALGYVTKPADVPQLVPAIEAGLARGREIAELKASAERLQTALTIEQRTRTAAGLLMERHGMNRQQAFDAMRGRARSQRRKLSEVAEAIIDAAELLNDAAHGEPGKN